MAASVYEDLWNLQSILQNPWGCMVNNDSYKGATNLIEEALRVMAATPIKVVSRSTAVPPKGRLAHVSCIQQLLPSLLWTPAVILANAGAYRHSRTLLQLLLL